MVYRSALCQALTQIKSPFIDGASEDIVTVYTGLYSFTMFSPTPSTNCMAIMVGRFNM